MVFKQRGSRKRRSRRQRTPSNTNSQGPVDLMQLVRGRARYHPYESDQPASLQSVNHWRNAGHELSEFNQTPSDQNNSIPDETTGRQDIGTNTSRTYCSVHAPPQELSTTEHAPLERLTPIETQPDSPNENNETERNDDKMADEKCDQLSPNNTTKVENTESSYSVPAMPTPNNSSYNENTAIEENYAETSAPQLQIEQLSPDNIAEVDNTGINAWITVIDTSNKSSSNENSSSNNSASSISYTEAEQSLELHISNENLQPVQNYPEEYFSNLYQIFVPPEQSLELHFSNEGLEAIQNYSEEHFSNFLETFDPPTSQANSEQISSPSSIDENASGSNINITAEENAIAENLVQAIDHKAGGDGHHNNPVILITLTTTNDNISEEVHTVNISAEANQISENPVQPAFDQGGGDGHNNNPVLLITLTTANDNISVEEISNDDGDEHNSIYTTTNDNISEEEAFDDDEYENYFY